MRACQAPRFVDQLVAEQSPGRRLAVLVDVVEDDAVVFQSPHPPGADLLTDQVLEGERLAGQPVGDRKGDEHGPGSTGQSSGDITRSHHRQTKSARAPAALRRLDAAAAAANHVRSTTVVGAASSSCLLRHALSPVTDRTASTRLSPLLPLEVNRTSNSGSSTIPPSDAARSSGGPNAITAHRFMLPRSTLGHQPQ